MINYFKNFKLTGLAIIVLIVSIGCSSDDDINQSNHNEEPSLKVQLATTNDYGSILVNQENQSLYFFAGDVVGVSNCKGGCANTWPPLLGELLDLEFGSSLDSNDFGEVLRENGQKQITFKGWPLYYFSPNADSILEAPGETLGDGRGDVFFVAKPDYSIMIGRQVVVEGEEPIVYLVDDRGVSLYFTEGDTQNTSNCSGGCAGVWPPFEVPNVLIVPSVLSLEDFSTSQRSDDLGPQLSIFGSPLYIFSQDSLERGSVLGQAGGPNANFFLLDSFD